MLSLYGYKKCDSCKKAEKFLSQNVSYSFIDITTNPPSASLLKKIYEHSGLDIKKFLNTSGEVYRSLGLKDKIADMSPGEIIELLAKNGRLIKRPLITDGQTVTLGFKEETMKTWL